MYAALDTTISISFPVGGSLPLNLRPLEDWPDGPGDKEQVDSALYQIAGYRDLYLLGSYGKGRQQIQVLNEHDRCCFSDIRYNSGAERVSFVSSVRRYENQVRRALSWFGSGSFRVVIDQSNHLGTQLRRLHTISHDTIDQIILATLNQALPEHLRTVK